MVFSAAESIVPVKTLCNVNAIIINKEDYDDGVVCELTNTQKWEASQMFIKLNFKKTDFEKFLYFIFWCIFKWLFYFLLKLITF